jgi:hypothetical protein
MSIAAQSALREWVASTTGTLRWWHVTLRTLPSLAPPCPPCSCVLGECFVWLVRARAWQHAWSKGQDGVVQACQSSSKGILSQMLVW